MKQNRKKRKINIQGKQYIYSVIEYNKNIQIRIYYNKTNIVRIHFTDFESWGIDVFRPKTIEILIKYFNKNYEVDNKTMELWLFKEKELFKQYLDYYFADENSELRSKYLENIRKYNYLNEDNIL